MQPMTPAHPDHSYSHPTASLPTTLVSVSNEDSPDDDSTHKRRQSAVKEDPIGEKKWIVFSSSLKILFHDVSDKRVTDTDLRHEWPKLNSIVTHFVLCLYICNEVSIGPTAEWMQLDYSGL